MISPAPAVRPLTDEDIRWDLDETSPWPPSRPVLDVAIKALPLVDDELVAQTIEQLAITVSDLRSELQAVRLVLSMALAEAHVQHVTIGHLRRRLQEINTARREELRRRR